MTRTAQVRVFSNLHQQEIWLYRALGGDPTNILPSLRIIKRWLGNATIQADVGTCATWLMYIGMREYNIMVDKIYVDRKLCQLSPILPETNRPRRNWRIGAYEPCASQTLLNDIEWFYTLNVDDGIIQIGRPEIMIDSWSVTHLMQDDELKSLKQIEDIIHQQLEKFDSLPKMMSSKDEYQKVHQPIFLNSPKEGITWKKNSILKHLTS